jgi:hypothetical protein
MVAHQPGNRQSKSVAAATYSRTSGRGGRLEVFLRWKSKLCLAIQ